MSTKQINAKVENCLMLSEYEQNLSKESAEEDSSPIFYRWPLIDIFISILVMHGIYTVWWLRCGRKEQSPLFDLFRAFDMIKSSHILVTFSDNTYFSIHSCATCYTLPSNISTLIVYLFCNTQNFDPQGNPEEALPMINLTLMNILLEMLKSLSFKCNVLLFFWLFVIPYLLLLFILFWFVLFIWINPFYFFFFW